MPWSRYVALAYRYARAGEEGASLPLPLTRWHRPRGVALIEGGDVAARYEVAAAYAAEGIAFEWRIDR